jgi:hypothetical protein
MIRHRSPHGASRLGSACKAPQRTGAAGSAAAAGWPRPATVIALCALLSACSEPPPSVSYFPLEAGHRWVYELSSEWENNTGERETLVISTLGQQSLPGLGKAWQRRSDSGLDYWLRADDTGIYRIASKNDLQDAPEPDKPARYVLKMPLAVGTSWQAPTTSYLLRRNADFPPEIRHTHKPVLMTYRIEALGQQVTTRAGRFDDCLKVRGSAVMRLFADPVVGFKDLPLETDEWYCKGVGLVKVQRAEPANSTFLAGGTMTLELTEWQ